jgi:hypothetical protein
MEPRFLAAIFLGFITRKSNRFAMDLPEYCRSMRLMLTFPKKVPLAENYTVKPERSSEV